MISTRKLVVYVMIYGLRCVGLGLVSTCCNVSISLVLLRVTLTHTRVVKRPWPEKKFPVRLFVELRSFGIDALLSVIRVRFYVVSSRVRLMMIVMTR